MHAYTAGKNEMLYIKSKHIFLAQITIIKHI